jgi:RNA polymerase sigma factor (TIGR02999 family)
MPSPEVDALFSVVYEELRRLAYSVKRRDASVTINPTALVHEAWLKMANSPLTAATSPIHFKRIAARAMRQVLVEAARRRNADKRGSGAVLMQFDDALEPSISPAAEVVALDLALRELQELDPRRAAGVEARFFGGFTAREIAGMLEISEETVLEDWRGAKAWLGYRLGNKSS